MAPTISRIELRMDDLERLVERARHTPLSDEDYDTLKTAIDTLGYVAHLVEEKGTTLAGLRQILFGARTEKTRDVLKRAGVEADDAWGATAGRDDDPDRRRAGRDRAVTGHGRHAGAAYEGATHVDVSHPRLKHGDRCPECLKGPYTSDR